MSRLVSVSIAIAASFAAQAKPLDYDVIIANGRIVDGTGNPWFRADVGIRGHRIATIGDLREASAKRRIDADGLVVAPGFVDMHSHASWSYLVDPRAVSKLTQGITLEVEGEGYSVAPMDDARLRATQAQFTRFGVTDRWQSLDDFFRLLERKPATINFATFVGSGTVRQLVIGDVDRPAAPQELERMCAIVDGAMRDGALGVFSALRYPPDLFNRTGELIAMARVAGHYGGIYQTHPRSEADALDASLDELFRISREADVPAQLTHVKTAYRQNWGKMGGLIKRIVEARASGLDITADIYPYEWAGGSFTDLLPPWAQDGGRTAIVARLNDPRMRERIKEALSKPAADWENEYDGAGGPSGLRFIDAGGNAALRSFQGLTLAEIAKRDGKDPRDAMFDVILKGDGSVISLISNEKDIREAMRQPWVAFGTDGPTVAPDGPLSKLSVHPRAYGALPRIFGVYVRELGLISLEDAVRRATSLPAQRLGLKDRGLLRPQFYADVAIFDPARIADTATYEQPHQVARGIAYVLVNGAVVLDQGRITNARPGMAVRGPGHGRSAAKAPGCLASRPTAPGSDRRKTGGAE